VGVKNDGAIQNAGDVDAAIIASASDKIAASKLTEVSDRPEGIHKNISEISRTESGNYLFTVKGEGFSIHQYDEYSSGKNMPMTIKVAISADRKIIDVLTLEHDETKGYGDKCATEEYYDTLRGVSGDSVVISKAPVTADVTDPGAISGATYTTEGYQKAIKRAFEAFDILTGGDMND
jgi:Na+-translocating ferredoxin:NAD+ oxidoreductase RnfG subunit